MGIANSGNYIDIPLLVTGTMCNFPSRFMSIDDNNSKGMSVMPFEINCGSMIYKY